MKKKNLKNLNLNKTSISVLRKHQVIGGFTTTEWTQPTRDNETPQTPGGAYESSHAIFVCYTGCGTNCQ